MARNDPPPDAYNSIQNAGGGVSATHLVQVSATHLVQVTHPFHPLSGRQCICVGERYNRYGIRVLLEVDSEIYSVPRHWTDLVAPDPEIVIGEGRSCFLLEDLIELTRLVACQSDSQDTEES